MHNNIKIKIERLYAVKDNWQRWKISVTKNE